MSTPISVDNANQWEEVVARSRRHKFRIETELPARVGASVGCPPNHVVGVHMFAKPIDTAPRDETWILLYFPNGDETEWKIGFWSEDDKNWFDSEAASYNMCDLNGGSPTHWLPLPEVPSTQGVA